MNRVMKDSGIEWIGEISENWKIVSFKRLGTPLTGSTPSKSRQEYWNGSIPWVSSKDIKSNYIFDSEDHITKEAVDDCGLTVFETGTLVFCVRSGILRHTFPVSVSLIPITINQDLRALNPSEEVNPAFLLYYMRGMNDTIVKLYQKIGATVESIEMDWFLYFPVVLPPLIEQNQIVELIDKKYAEIDLLIAAKEKSNSLLKEWRQSIIYEAVTKGLDSSVPMKDSGIEWIGKIPASWKINKLKFLGSLTIGLTYSPDELSEDGTLVLRSSNIQDGKIVHADDVFVSKEISEKIRTQEGDILICSRNGSPNLIGKNAVITEEFSGQTFGAFMTVFHSKYNYYIRHLLNSSVFDYYIGSFLTSTINQLTTANLSNILVPIPQSEAEMMRIADYIDDRTQQINKIIKKNELSIQQLKEYRQSLIYEAVTGKIEV